MYYLTYRSNGVGIHTAFVQHQEVALRCATLWCETPFLSADVMDDKGKPLMRAWRSLTGVETQMMR